MQKNSLRQRIQRKVKWCHKMEKKLAVIVDNKKVTTEAENIELCSSACDVAMETCSSQSYDALRKCREIGKKIEKRFYLKKLERHWYVINLRISMPMSFFV